MSRIVEMLDVAMEEMAYLESVLTLATESKPCSPLKKHIKPTIQLFAPTPCDLAPLLSIPDHWLRNPG